MTRRLLVFASLFAAILASLADSTGDVTTGSSLTPGMVDRGTADTATPQPVDVVAAAGHESLLACVQRTETIALSGLPLADPPTATLSLDLIAAADGVLSVSVSIGRAEYDFETPFLADGDSADIELPINRDGDVVITWTATVDASLAWTLTMSGQGLDAVVGVVTPRDDAPVGDLPPECSP